MSGTRILLAKPGLDRHDRALNVIAFALREAGVPALPLRGQQDAPPARHRARLRRKDDHPLRGAGR